MINSKEKYNQNQLFLNNWNKFYYIEKKNSFYDIMQILCH